MVLQSELIAFFPSRRAALAAAGSLPGSRTGEFRRDGHGEILTALGYEGEWWLYHQGDEAVISSSAAQIREAGEARSVIAVPLDSQPPATGELPNRFKLISAYLQSVWELQLRELEPEQSGVESSPWGIAEAAFEEK